MDFAIKSLLPQASGSASAANVVDDDPNQMAEEFAKLLVAQISNQDPEEPIDATEIISQNAQFTASLATVRLANQMAHYEQVASTMAVMGRPVEYVDPNDFSETPQIGIVQGADYTVTPPALIIDGLAIPLENVTRVDVDPGSTAEAAQAQELVALKQMQLLGQSVEYFDPGTGANSVGVVDDVDLISGQGLLTVNGTSVPITDVIRVIN